MIEFIYYLAKVSMCSGILFLYYLLALRNRRFHQWNRFYLLFSVVLSLALPLLQVTIYHYLQPEPETSFRLLQVVQSADEYLEEVTIYSRPSMSLEQWGIMTYTAISVGFALFLLYSVRQILRMAARHSVTIIDQIRFVRTREPGTPFSFFRYIFWNEAIDLGEPTGQQIFRHELVHVQERHSADKIFMQVVLTIFWCNPFFWLIRKELKMVHEFIADQRSVGEGGTQAFAAMILQSSYPQHFTALTNPFFQTSIKRRLKMLSKNQRPKLQYLGRLIALPVIAVTALAFTIRTKEVHKSALDQPITVVIDAGHGLKPDGKYDGARVGAIYEDQINLELARSIEKLNMDPNIRIVLTRSTERIVDLKRRVEISRDEAADLFISLHVNHQPNGSDLSGIQLRLPDNRTSSIGQGSQVLASALVQELSKVYTVDPNLIAQGSSVYVLRATPCPAVLLEVGYLSNPGDLRFISTRENQEKIARQVLAAIAQYAKQKDRISFEAPAAMLKKVDSTQPPAYYLDGRPVSAAEVERINPSDIDRVNVLKGKEATDRFGAKGANGVVEVFTKSTSKRAKVTGQAAGSPVDMKNGNPIYVLNGDVVTKADIEKIDPGTIASVNVYKGPDAINRYGEKAKDGAIEIITRNGLTKVEQGSEGRDTVPQKAGPVFSKTEQAASIETTVWRKFLESNLQSLIESAARQGMRPGQYTVLTRFIVETDGSLSELQTIKDPGFGLGQRTREMLKASPKWTPARQNGTTVRSYHTQPVTFVISE